MYEKNLHIKHCRNIIKPLKLLRENKIPTVRSSFGTARAKSFREQLRAKMFRIQTQSVFYLLLQCRTRLFASNNELLKIMSKYNEKETQINKKKLGTTQY